MGQFVLAVALTAAAGTLGSSSALFVTFCKVISINLRGKMPQMS